MEEGSREGGTAAREGLQGLIGMARRAESSQERMAAIDAIGRQGDPRGVIPLIECLSDPDPVVRRRSVEALHRIGSVRAVPALLQRLADRSEEWLTRTYAAEALGRIGTTSAVESLVKVLMDGREEPFVRIYVVDVLSRVKHPLAAEALTRCLKDEDRQVRRAVTRALGGRGSVSIPAS